MKLLGYTRVSAASADARPQLDALVAAGVAPAHFFSDVTSGAKDAADRPDLRLLLEQAEEGDTIVVWRIDRLGRSLVEVLDTVRELSERGINIRSVQDDIDPSTTHGRLMLDLLAKLAEYERHLTSELIAEGTASALRLGKRRGRPPVDADAVHAKLRVIEDARARGLPAAQAAQLAGWSRATYYRHQRQVGTQP